MRKMEEFKFTIYGNPVTKKNHSRIVFRGNKPKLLPSEQYSAYETNFKAECMIRGLWNKMLSERLNIACVYYMQTHRKVDLTNLLSATMDCLVTARVIEDDNCNIAYSHDGSCVKYDKNNPRVEITIKEVSEC